MTGKIDYSKSKTASKGRDGDQFMAHIAPGEIIVPPVISDELKEALYAEMRAAGIDPAQYEANGGEYSINPETGLPEFGFLSKVFKKVKNVVKKIAPIAQVVLPFIPGIGLPLAAGLGAGLGAVSGQGLKGIAAGALSGASGGIGSALGKGISSATGLSGLASKSIGSALVGGAGKALSGGNLRDSILSGGISGLGSLYQSGGFNNLGKAFKDGGASGLLTQFGDNISGTGDVLEATGGATAKAIGGGGSSSYSDPATIDASQVGKIREGSFLPEGTKFNVPDVTTTGSGEKITWNTPSYKPDITTLPSGEKITWNAPNAAPSAPDNLFDRIVNSSPEGADDMASNKNRGLTSLANAGIGVYSNNKAAEQLLKTQQQGLAALQPYMNQQWNPTDLENEPGYQFQLKQGQKGIDSAAAARGEYYSGDAIRAAGEYATGLADSNAQSAYSRWRGDQNANIQSVLAQYGMLSDQGNTKANKTIANSNVLTDSISNYFAPEDDFKSLIAKYLAQRG